MLFTLPFALSCITPSHIHTMLSWGASLFHPLVALILVANYFATPGLCSHDPGTIPWKSPRSTNNRFPLSDSVEIAWLSPSLGQQTFDLDLVLPNRTWNGWIPSKCFCFPSPEPSTQTFENRWHHNGWSDRDERKRFQSYHPGPIAQEDHPSLQLPKQHIQQ